MKKTKIIIPALGLLVLSTAASVTGTVAWFAANATVNANGMVLKAKTDSQFLVISHDSASATWQAGVTATSVNLTYPANAEVLPTSRQSVESTLSWVTASGTSTTNGAASGALTALDISETSNYGVAGGKNYFVYDVVYVGLAKGSSAADGKKVTCDVDFTASSSSELNKCLTVGVFAGSTIGANNWTESYVLGSNATSKVDKAGSNTIYSGANLSDTAGQPIAIYAYFDGNDAACTTANAINLANITINLTFNLVDAQ